MTAPKYIAALILAVAAGLVVWYSLTWFVPRWTAGELQDEPVNWEEIQIAP